MKKLKSDYAAFLEGPAKPQWERIGPKKRAGVATPLFSLYSEASIGIGELPDLKLLVDWCHLSGNSIIQLLPLNDVGYKFTPYDALSTFALDPMYLALDRLQGVDPKKFKKDLAGLKQRFPCGRGRVDYGIKGAKMELLWRMFNVSASKKKKAFEKFCSQHHFWLEDYAFFKVIKEIRHEAGWEAWEAAWKSREAGALNALAENEAVRLTFQKWLQWQLFEQFQDVKAYANSKQVFLMGDLPLLVSRDSADVWARQEYFKLDLLSGAPPDAFFARGQRWGMPPYNWSQIAAHRFDYVKEKLRYAAHFYDFFRLDHAVGLFRLWTIPAAEPPENAGMYGRFDPSDESLWESHGRQLLEVMLHATPMLPCAEDLGVVPECSFEVLAEFGIPGMDVQRWIRDWGKTYDFKSPDTYRKNAIAVISTHDMTSFLGWWQFEAATVDAVLFERRCQEQHIPFDAVKDRLFDWKRSGHGRLFWHPDVQNEMILLKILNLPAEHARVFLDFYRGTHGEREKFLHYLYGSKVPGLTTRAGMAGLMRDALRKVNETSAIFSIQLLQDWLSCDPDFDGYAWDYRINFPGTHGDHNWVLALPWSLEALLKRPVTAKIRALNRATGRI